jgi:hypothetical protein
LAHFYRFKLKVPAKQVVKFVVKYALISPRIAPLSFTPSLARAFDELQLTLALSSHLCREQSAEDQRYQLEDTTKAWVEEWSAAVPPHHTLTQRTPRPVRAWLACAKRALVLCVQGYLTSDVKKTLDAIAKRNEKAARLHKKINRSDAHLRSINEDINRIDSCLGSLALSKSSLFAYVAFLL